MQANVEALLLWPALQGVQIVAAVCTGPDPAAASATLPEEQKLQGVVALAEYWPAEHAKHAVALTATTLTPTTATWPGLQL